MANKALAHSCVGFDRTLNVVLVGITKAEAKLLWPTVRPPRTIDSRATIFVMDNNADGAKDWSDDPERTAAFDSGLASCLLLRLDEEFVAVLRYEHVLSFVS